MSVSIDLPHSDVLSCIKDFREDSLLAYTAMNLHKFTPTRGNVFCLPLREALQGQNLNI